MIKKGLVFCLLSLFLALNAGAQDFSKTFNGNYPIFAFTMLGYDKAPTANALITPANFMNFAGENGTIKTKLEKKNIKNGTLLATLLVEITEKASGKKTRARMQFSVQSDDMSEQNYLTYLRYIDLTNGTSLKFEYDGYTQRSLGEVLGGFSELMKTFYNIDKLNIGLSSRDKLLPN